MPYRKSRTFLVGSLWHTLFYKIASSRLRPVRASLAPVTIVSVRVRRPILYCPGFSVHLRPLLYLRLRFLRCQHSPFIRWRAVLAVLSLSQAVVYLKSGPCFALIQPFASQFRAYFVSPSIANFESPYTPRGWFPAYFFIP